MRYTPGQSGNLSGRPPGIGRTVELKRMLFSRAEEVVNAVIDKAIDGDISAAKLILDRLVPPLRATDPPVSIPRPDSGDIADQSRYVLDSLLSGGLSPDAAAKVLQSLVLHQTVCELKGLEARIAALESANGNSSSTSDSFG